MAKLRYEVDPHNRLIIRKSGRKSELGRFRQVLDGQFKLDDKNNLIYHVKTPLPKGSKIPHQVKLSGQWSLNRNHDLVFTLDKWGRQTFGDQLTLQGEILDVSKNALLFSMTTRQKKGAQSLYAIKLDGTWQADKNNRLAFRVRKGKEGYDALTFDGIWNIGKNYEIVYEYRKTRRVLKSKRIHVLAFKGKWDIEDKTRISYCMDRDTDSVFNFKTSVGVFRNKFIKYEAGIGLSRRREPVKRIIKFFGTWKISKTSGLEFEVEYGNRKVHALAFGAEARLTDKDTVLFKLRDNLNREMDAEIKLSHKIFKGDGQAFLRLFRSGKRPAILLGAGVGW